MDNRGSQVAKILQHAKDLFSIQPMKLRSKSIIILCHKESDCCRTTTASLLLNGRSKGCYFFFPGQNSTLAFHRLMVCTARTNLRRHGGCSCAYITPKLWRFQHFSISVSTLYSYQNKLPTIHNPHLQGNALNFLFGDTPSTCHYVFQ